MGEADARSKSWTARTAEGAAPAVGELRADEAEAAVRVLARAFGDNPLNRAVIGAGAERRVRVNAAGLRPQIPALLESGCALGARSAAEASAALAGVLLATPPGGHALGTPRWSVRLRALAAQGWGVSRRWAEVQDLLVPQRPAAPHWYLALLGVEPARQRAGVGAALVAAFLTRVDATGQSVWLETDRPENVAFYRRAGFVAAGELRVFGVPVWLLQRPARGG
ncbi:MAG: GNAT family N-acetyltransferase [Myxococcota bacterium]